MNSTKAALSGGLGAQTDNAKIRQVSDWFSHHVTLFGQPYTLDDDQIRAVIDDHQNTLVTARAGSGKTRVIVAKVAYLVAHGLARLDEIAIFMFNRTAAAEVNERIAAVKIDGLRLTDISSARVRDARRYGVAPLTLGRSLRMTSEMDKTQAISIASTFHKFALDIVKRAGENPQIISSEEHDLLVRELLSQTLADLHLKISPKDRQEMLGLVNNFITRAGQYYPGYNGLKNLETKITEYCQNTLNQPDLAKNRRIHQIAFSVYRQYLASLRSPKIDFNLLMSVATETLHSPTCPEGIRERIAPLKYILIDEYQDFSYLFFALVQAMRSLAPKAHLFCVGDDWQAINRFAGSNVDYFINFARYFPQDVINIPLVINYRSDRRIVAEANQYMLKHYNPAAIPAQAFSHKLGKIYRVNPNKTRFDAHDIHEDALGDGRILLALSKASGNLTPGKIPLGAARLLKTTLRILRHHPHEDIMLLHRHNFTSFDSITLDVFQAALRQLVIDQGIMTSEDYARQVRCFTMHKSKGLEANVVILLELNRDIVQNAHPHATIFQLFGDTRAAEIADQQRLIYVALTRAKHRLYLLSSDSGPII